MFDNRRHTIIFIITVKAPRVEVTASMYSEQMENALTDTETADVIFLMDGGQKVKGHKVILCSASNFFCEVFGIAGLDEVGLLKRNILLSCFYEINMVQYNQIDNFSIIAYGVIRARIATYSIAVYGRTGCTVHAGTVRNDRELFNQIIVTLAVNILRF